MMRAVCLLGATATASASVSSASVGSTGHAAVLTVSPSSSSSSSSSGTGSRWLTFPSAKEQHHALRDTSLKAISKSKSFVNVAAESHEEFFSVHRDALGLHRACEMNLLSERQNPSSTLVHRTYQQVVGGVRVFGGSFKMTLSTTGKTMEVLNTHGTPLTEAALNEDFNGIDVAKALRATPEDRAIRLSLKTYLASSRIIDAYEDLELNNIELLPSQPVELVWYTLGNDVKLAYHTRGTVATEKVVSFYAFVDVETNNVLKLVQLNDEEHLMDDSIISVPAGVDFSSSSSDEQRALKDSSLSVSAISPSPFSSPISDAEIYCYDQYLKDFNDDQDDNYYDPDPDRFSSQTLVFDTTSGNHTYPTTDAEMNLLIDNTLYSKYMYYSLSGGVYYTWQKNESALNIEYNLSLANAYFDGVWGIHFGTGFITDDVVAHEWSHGYTQTGDDLVYERQSGSMNEGFSDIFGEGIDILNEDSPDTTVPRQSSPASCTSTMNPRQGHGPTPGTDTGNRWSIGEEVSYYNPANGDGSFRDMYKPECFFHPGATHSPYYSCTTYYDHGGVHLNSGVFNHLFSVLVDGGEFVEGSTVTTVAPLGIVKTLNLYWRTHEELTANSQFYDFAMTMNEVCTLNIGETLYYPNVFNNTIIEVDSLTTADCSLVREAISGSGMDRTDDVCPNIDCSGERCEWVQCPAVESGNFVASYEDYDYSMGDSRVTGSSGNIDPACGTSGTSKYIRVFDQNHFHLDKFTLSCIEFGYLMLGQTTVTIDVYIDTDGGDPNYDSLHLLASKDVTTVNANNHMQVQTVSLDTPLVLPFNTSLQTVVVVMTAPVMSEGFISGGGQVNTDVTVYGRPTGQTFVGGECMSTLLPSNSTVQWYVRLQGSSTYRSGGSSSDEYDENEIIAVIVAGSLVVIAVMAFSYYVMTKNYDKLSKHQQLDEESRL